MKKKKPEIKDILRTIDIEHKKKIYGVKDIVRICGLDRNQVFYWSKTFKVIEPEYITPGRQLFTFRALLDFRLIFELQHLGLRPERIRAIVFLFELIDNVPSIQRFPIWDMFLEDRPKYEQKGYYLLISELAGEKTGGHWPHGVECTYGTESGIEDALLREMANDPFKMKNSITVNLLRIIHEVEEATGECLE